MDGLGIVLLPHFQAVPLVAQGCLTQVLEEWSFSLQAYPWIMLFPLLVAGRW